jgi:hypothetical protein
LNSKYYFLLLLGLSLASLLAHIPSFWASNPNMVISSGTSTLAPENFSRNAVIAGMIEKMNESEIDKTVGAMVRIPTREMNTPGNIMAADYIYSRLSGIPGLHVEYQGGDLKNIIATLPGEDRSSNETVIVGSHYDTRSSNPAIAPGATDDACGVAIILEQARVMSQYKFNHTVAFAFWNGEEDGMKGSRSYIEYAAKNSLRIPLYVNFDSSCYDPEGRNILDIMYNQQSAWAQEMMARYNDIYGIDFNLTYNVHHCSADHTYFWSYGYPAVMTHEESHGPAHTPSDIQEQVSKKYALKNGQLGMTISAHVAEVQGLRTMVTCT